MADSKSKHTIVIGAQDTATPVIQRIQGQLKSFQGVVGALGGAMAGAAIGSFIKSSIEEAAKFDTAIRKINTLLPQSERSLGKFSDGLREISKTGVNQDINQLADGLYEVLSASVPANKALEFTDVAAKAATAGFTDMTTSVRALSAVMNAYKMNAEDVGKISDILFVTQNRGATTFGQMAEHLGQVLPLASSTGVKFEELAAAISTSTRQGINTGMAITGLRSILAGFIEKGDASKLSTLGLVGALEDLQNQTGGDNKKLQDYLGRIEGVTIALSLMGDNAKLLREDLAAMGAAAGTTNDAFTEMASGMQGNFNKMIAVWSEFKDSFGKGFSEVLSDEDVKNTDRIMKAIGNILGNTAAETVGWIKLPFEVLFTLIDEVSRKIKTDPMYRPGGSYWKGTTPGKVPLIGGNADWRIASPWSDPTAAINMEAYNRVVSDSSVFIDKQAESAKNLADVMARLNIPTLDSMNEKIAEMNLLLSSTDPIVRAVATEGLEELNKQMEKYLSIVNRGFGNVSGLSGGDTSDRMSRGLRAGPRVRQGALPTVTRNEQDEEQMTGYEEWLESFTQKLQNYAMTFNYLMNSVTQSIVQGAISGSLTIKSVFQSLRNAVLQLLADLAARAASAWFLTLLFPALSFKSAFGFASGGGWSTQSAPRISPSQFNGNGNGRTMGGGTRVVFNGPVYGSPDAIAAHIEDTLSRRMKTGQSRLIR